MASNSLEAANAQFKKTQKAQDGGQDRPQYEIDALTARKDRPVEITSIGQRDDRDLIAVKLADAISGVLGNKGRQTWLWHALNEKKSQQRTRLLGCQVLR